MSGQMGLGLENVGVIEWGTIKLSETTSFIVDNRGKTVPTSQTGIPLIATNCIDSRNLFPSYENLRFVSQDTYENWFRSHPKPMDIILTLKGSQNGAVCLVPDPVDFCIAQDMVALRPNSEAIDPLYLFAALRSDYIQDQIKNLDVSGVIPHFKKGDFDKLIIPLPDRKAQKGIGEIYHSLCLKIGLLHRQNKTLEAMAETLFRQWFVEEAEEDWEEKKLGELVTVKRGGSPRPIQDYLSDSGYRWLKISDVTSLNTPFIFDIKEHIKIEGLSKTTLLSAGKLVLSNSATPAIPKILMVDSCIHDGWLHFPKSYFSNEYLYLLFNHIRPELLQQGNGSIFTNLKTDILKEFVVKLPPQDKLLDFQELVAKIFRKLLSNTKQIKTVEKLRDNLLPKLMSGEVRVDCALR